MAALNIHNNILTLFNDNCNFVLNTKTKSYKILKQLTSPAPKYPHEQYLGLITYCSALSNNAKLYAVADQKNLLIWETSSWTQTCTKTLERGASKIVFTPSNQSIIVADKTGDVYSFLLTDDNPKGTLILGHLSILLDVLITPDEKYIITCDRDEKIRVSHFPNAYNIECFCLGHTEFVTKITLLDNILLSCSGDGSLKFWSYLKGQELFSYSVLNDISIELNECIITNVSVLHVNDIKMLCLSVHKYDGILIYKCTTSCDFSVELVHKIECKEPLDFSLDGDSLWILNCSNSSILDVRFWNGKIFQQLHNLEIDTIVNIVNKECSFLRDCTYIDYSVLYKKYLLKEEKRKKIRLE